MRWNYNNELLNVPINSHKFFLHLEGKFSRYQQHEGYLVVIQSNFPGSDDDTGAASPHSVTVEIGGPQTYRNYPFDENGDVYWDGTWTENCGPNSWQPSVECVGYMAILFRDDVSGTNTLQLYAPVVILYDDAYHVYDIIIDTAATDANGTPTYTAEWSLDNTIITAVYDGFSQLDGQNFFIFSDYGTFRGPLYFPVDGMNWRMWNDNYDLSPYAQYADTTCPTGDINRIIVAMNWRGPADQGTLNYLISAEAWAWRDYFGNLHPANVLSPNYPLQYTPEIYHYGDASPGPLGGPYFATGTATVPWSVFTWLSSEIYDQGTPGAGLLPANSDMYP